VKHLDRTSKDILRQLLNGLAHIHRRGYIHRDIKPDNVLYKLDRVIRYHQDFLRAREEGFGCMTPGMMTVNYRAPEMTQSENSTRCVDGEQRWWPAMFINGPINPKINTDDMEKSTVDVDA
jgi:serine/threonine protein kinase